MVVPLPNLSHWDKHNLSQWDRQLGIGCACPSGTSTLPVPNLSHWDWERSKETVTCVCPMDRSYTHTGGLSLSQDKPYAHDGTCPSPTCPNLSHKVELQGRALWWLRSSCKERFQTNRIVIWPVPVTVRVRRWRLAWKGKSSWVTCKRFITPCRRFALWIGQTSCEQKLEGFEVLHRIVNKVSNGKNCMAPPDLICIQGLKVD